VEATAEKGRFSKLEILAESAGVAPGQAIVAFRYIVRCPAHAFVRGLLTLGRRSLRLWGRRVSGLGPARGSR
jgi:hypothetical protein